LFCRQRKPAAAAARPRKKKNSKGLLAVYSVFKRPLKSKAQNSWKRKRFAFCFSAKRPTFALHF
ncbi:MAG: hypothetical protein ABIO24_09925, partial [Saprospiraceae bacterium]